MYVNEWHKLIGPICGSINGNVVNPSILLTEPYLTIWKSYINSLRVFHNIPLFLPYNAMAKTFQKLSRVYQCS